MKKNQKIVIGKQYHDAQLGVIWTYMGKEDANTFVHRFLGDNGKEIWFSDFELQSLELI